MRCPCSKHGLPLRNPSIFEIPILSEMRLTLRRIFGPYKEVNTIDDFKPVRSRLDISRSLKYYLSMRDHEKYGDDTKVVRAINDTLQGRGGARLSNCWLKWTRYVVAGKIMTRTGLCSVSVFKISNIRKLFYPKSTPKPATVNTAMKCKTEERSSIKSSTTKRQGMAFRRAFSAIPFSTG